MKIITKGKTKFNPLRKIIKQALDDTKNLEWSNDRDISKAAIIQWDRLNKIFQKLGSFEN